IPRREPQRLRQQTLRVRRVLAPHGGDRPVRPAQGFLRSEPAHRLETSARLARVPFLERRETEVLLRLEPPELGGGAGLRRDEAGREEEDEEGGEKRHPARMITAKPAASRGAPYIKVDIVARARSKAPNAVSSKRQKTILRTPR